MQEQTILVPITITEDDITYAYDIFAYSLKQWMIHQKLGRGDIIERCHNLMTYCDGRVDAWVSPAYYTALKQVIQSFLALL